MIRLLLLLSLFHPSHRSQFVRETLSELKQAAAVVGEYQHDPPMLTSGHDDEIYITRAETDINIALGALSKYKHHHMSEEDVRSAMSQLSRDLEDLPPAKWGIDDTKAKI